jgi:hypothetical protein
MGAIWFWSGQRLGRVQNSLSAGFVGWFFSVQGVGEINASYFLI